MSQRDLTQGSVPLSLFKLTAPLIMGVGSSILVQTLEIGFIGQLSTEHVAAVVFTFPLTMILISVALGISIGTSSVIARSVGGADRDDVQRLGTHSLILVTVSMAILSLLAWLSIDTVFIALGAPSTMLPLIHSYLDIYYPGTVLFTTTMMAGSIMRANGNANIPGMVMTLGALFNLAIDPILIFGWFGMPRLELAGAAIAMTLTRVITTAVLFYFVYANGFVRTRRVTEAFVGSCKRILTVGVPAMATQLIGPVSAVVITRLLADHGEIVVAGFGVAIRIEAVAVMVLFALSGSIGPFVGQNWGGEHLDRVREGLRVTNIFCLAWGFTAAFAMLLFGGVLASLVDDNHQVIATATLYLAIVPWSYGMWGVLMMASASFNALGKPIPSTILSFTRMFIVYVPLAVTLNGLYGYQGIFIATAISNVVMGVAGYIWFRRAIFGRSDIAQQSTRRSAI